MRNDNYIVVGQIVTSRLEAIDWYLEQKKKSFVSIGFPSPFSKSKNGRIKLFSDGVNTDNSDISFLVFQGSTMLRTLLMPFTFFSYAWQIFLALLKGSFNDFTFIGIATFSTACGIIAKKIGLVKYCIYYCLDYYPPPSKSNRLNFLYHKIYKMLDKFCVKNADTIWDISPEISNGRKMYSGFDDTRYKRLIVPLGYIDEVSRDVAIEDRWSYSIGFVGTISDNQGLELVLNGISLLKARYPLIKMHIIGSGPHYNVIQRLIADLGISSNVKLYGFVSSEDEVYDILSKCMVGVATWNGSESDNSRFADPGKPKLYALLGLPIIITKFPIISKTINQFGAGIIIDFNSEEFINAIDVLFSDSIKYQSIMSNLISFQKICRARTIFDEAFFKTNTLLLEGVN